MTLADNLSEVIELVHVHGQESCSGHRMQGEPFHIPGVYVHISGSGIMKPFLEQANISLAQFAETITMLLSYDRLTLGRNIRQREVMYTHTYDCGDLMRNIVRNLPKRVVKKGTIVDVLAGVEEPPVQSSTQIKSRQLSAAHRKTG